MKKKNKWYEVLGAGLLSVSAMYLCTALVVTGCSNDNSGVMGEDPEEYSEAVVPGDEEEIEEPSSSEKEEVAETSDTEETSNSEDAVKTEKPADVDEPADTEEKSEQTESSNSEEKSEQAETLNSEETPEPAESGDETAPEESTEPNKAEPEEKTDPAETTEPAELVEPEEPETPVETTEPDNETESGETTEPDGGKKVARHTREWYYLRDTVSYFIQEECWRDKNALEKLEEKRYSLISRCEWDIEVNDCSMEESAFHAAYQSNEDVMRKLTDAGILWDGSEWEGWNPIEDGESTVVLDTALSAWSDGRVYVHAVYRVSYHLNSDPDTEHSFLLDVPVKYMRVD